MTPGFFTLPAWAGALARRARLAWRMPLIAAVMACAGCAGVGLPAPPGCGAPGPLVVCTQQGALQGVAEGEVLAFKGIPYAKAPVGALRWRPPQPPEPWQGVRAAAQFGPVCPQLAGTEVVGDEDCLSLNIWKPLRPAGAPLPVMVFLTGGGNHAYSGQGGNVFGGVRYGGEALVPHGVIHVSFNNRLGALGFLATPALSAEAPGRVSGNYGNLDQVAMLRWLQHNIAAFGGDPKRVMLFGTSAGGGSICALLAAPAARGLFQAAALHSSVPTGCEMPTLAEAEQGTGREVSRLLGCTGADGAACLRGKAMPEVVRALPGSFGLFPRLYGPNVDGQVFPQQPLAAIRERRHAAMPVIIGNTTEETMQFVGSVGALPDAASYEAALGRVFGAANAARVRAEYPPEAFSTPRQALVRATTDAFFTCRSRRVALALAAAQPQPVYRYLFGHSLQNDPELKALGAVHTVEHPFFFSWQGSYRPTDADRAVQRTMLRYWTQLARSGALAGQVDPAWLPATSASDAYLFIEPAPALRTGGGDAHCGFWDAVTLPWPHL